MVHRMLRSAFHPAAPIVAAFLAVAAIMAFPLQADATLPYSRKEDKKCYYCHVDWQNDKHVLTEQGQYYFDNNHSFEGLPAELEAGPAPPPEEPEEESKGMPIGVMAGMLFFFAMIVLVVVSIFKAPVKQPESSKADQNDGDDGGPSR